MNNPQELDYLFHRDPALAEIIVSGDDKKLEEFVGKEVDKYIEQRKKEEEEFNRLSNSDPNDPNAQKKIAEYIKKKNIEENYKQAMEYMPETMIRIHMLYIDMEINKVKIQAFIDTGAQNTIISKRLAEKCGLMNLCDERFQGVAKGVGTSKITGVIHAAQIKIQGKYLMCRVSVIESISVGFIIGLDNLRAHRCNIDLTNNCLVFPDAGINVKFLSDAEVKKIEDKENKEDDIMENENELIEQVKQESLKDKK